MTAPIASNLVGYVDVPDHDLPGYRFGGRIELDDVPHVWELVDGVPRMTDEEHPAGWWALLARSVERVHRRIERCVQRHLADDGYVLDRSTVRWAVITVVEQEGALLAVYDPGHDLAGPAEDLLARVRTHRALVGS